MGAEGAEVGAVIDELGRRGERARTWRARGNRVGGRVEEEAKARNRDGSGRQDGGKHVLEEGRRGRRGVYGGGQKREVGAAGRTLGTQREEATGAYGMGRHVGA